jgi:glycosyltransferase 2 family protein
MTILVWLPIIFAYWIGMKAVQLDPTWAMAGFVVAAAALSVAAPSSPGQVGVFHAGVIFTLVSILGQPQGPAASFAFLYHAINLIVMSIMGVIGLLATGATFRNVLDATRQFANRKSTSPS